MTIDAWVRPDVVSGPHAIVAKYSAALNISWVLMDLDGFIRFGVYEAGSVDLGRVVDTISPVLTAGEWQHVAGTFDLATQDIWTGSTYHFIFRTNSRNNHLNKG